MSGNPEQQSTVSRKASPSRKAPPLKILDPLERERKERQREWLRGQVSRLLWFFYATNASVLVLIGLIWFTGGQAIITERVLLALIAASAAQLGTLVLFVGKKVFGAEG